MATNFYLDSRTDKNGDSPIRLSINIKGARYVTSSGYKIPATKWDKVKQQVKRGSTNNQGITYSVINAGLTKIAQVYIDFENECLLMRRKPSVSELKEIFAIHFGRKTGVKNEEQAKAVQEYLKEFIKLESISQSWNRSTCSNFHLLLQTMNKFQPEWTFSEVITKKFILDFIVFLKEEQGWRNSTINLNLRLLQWFLRWAIKKQFCTSVDFKEIFPKIKITKPTIVFLEWEELLRMYNYQIPQEGEAVQLCTALGQSYEKRVRKVESLAVIRDIFCFCAFTSLRYSDAKKLMRSSVNDKSITIVTVKTNTTIIIELNKYARAILDKYSQSKNYIFPSVNSTFMLEGIRMLGELCGINSPITDTYYRGNDRIEDTRPKYEFLGTHTARRTFICNALMMGIPAEIVMKWTGHSSYASMKPYIDISNKAKENAMELFNQR